jgi:hypothetical protein
MLLDHRYSWAEAAQVCAWPVEEIRKKAAELKIDPSIPTPPETTGRVRILPYPGTRETRRGFFANLDAQRGTKASVFLPWEPTSYVVVDLPEAIFSQKRLLFLTHTDVPTIWDQQNVLIENIDWTRTPSGGLRHERELPNKIAFGASIEPAGDEVSMELWLRNGSDELLTGLRTQICNLLKGAPSLHEQTTTNKIFGCPSAAVSNLGKDRWVVTSWERCGRAWGHPLVPCLHADPVLPDCGPGETVKIRGKMWFFKGNEEELRKRL